MIAINEPLRDALDDAGLTAAHIKALAEEAADEDLGNWSRARFGQVSGLSGPAAFAAYTVIHALKANEVVVPETAETIPVTPPYLDRPEDYDAHDGAQFYTHPETGQMYRWDGKRSPHLPGVVIDPSGRVWGFRRPVLRVDQVTVDGVTVPKKDALKAAREEAQKLGLTGFDWFHHGYGCWVSSSGKAYGVVAPEKRDRVVRAAAALVDRGPLAA